MHSAQLGRALAQIHIATADFVSPHPRFVIDLPYLLDQPLNVLQPVLAHRPADWTYLRHLADELHLRIQDLPASALMCGVCHGDFQRKNTRISEAGVVTTFDFDHCGLGWHAYDLAVFRPASLDPAQETLWHAFLDGYMAERHLSEVDRAAIPLFVASIRIHTMGFFAAHRYNSLWGSDMMHDRFFDVELAFLRSWMAAHAA